MLYNDGNKTHLKKKSCKHEPINILESQAEISYTLHALV